MRYNYDIKSKLSERARKYFLDYILERMAGNREPLKCMSVTSTSNQPGTAVNAIKGKIHTGVVESNVTNGEIQLKLEIPLGTEGSIKYVSLIAGSLESGQVVETLTIPTIEKLSIVSIELTVILVAYDN